MSDLLTPTPDPTLRIAVVCGGSSAEVEVSRVSAAGVTEALAINYPHVSQLELCAELAGSLAAFGTDVVFPVLHGPPGEDGTFQGFLEILGYPYVGSDVHGSAVAMDKIVAKKVFAAHDLPLIDDAIASLNDGIDRAIREISSSLGSSVVVKPARQGSALGVTLIDNASQLRAGLAGAFEYDEQLLIEKRVVGKEITVGVIDTDTGTQAFPVIEVRTPTDTWYDYEHRYTSGLSEHLVPAELDEAQTDRLQAIAIKAHQVLGCRDLSRADFIVPDKNTEYLLEVNTLPGMTPTSLYPDGANAFGLSFAELVSYLVERASSRRTM